MQHQSRRLLMVSACLASLMVISSGLAQAHTLWMAPAPRDDMDGWKPGRSAGFMLPCGVARKAGQPNTTMTSGAMQMVQYKETVNHDGCFVIDFAPGEGGPFNRLDVLIHPAKMQSGTVYSRMVKLPDMECTDCIIRVRQYMAKTTPCPPDNTPDMDPNYYYSCANITLKKGAGGGGSADGGGVPPSADAGVPAAGSDASVVTPGTGGQTGGTTTGGSSGDNTGGSYGTGGASGDPSGGAPGSTSSGGAGGAPSTSSPDAAATTGNAPNTRFRGSVGACALGQGSSSAPLALVMAAVGVAFLRRRRR
jgi:MYXO-CTERM domain-containing protein